MAPTNISIIGNHQDDLEKLLKDIPEIPKLGAPGVLSVFGPNAFPFLVGKHKACLHPLGAAARFGDGRIIIYAHDGYSNHSKDSAVNQLIVNNIHWCTEKINYSEIIVGIHNKLNNEMVTSLQNLGYSAVAVGDDDLSNSEKLMEFDLLLIQNVSYVTHEQVETIKTFVKLGGGLILGNTAWAWDHYGPSGDIRCDHPGNSICHEAGLGWTISGYLEGTSGTDGFLTDLHLLNDSHALDSWECLRNAVKDGVDIDNTKNLVSILEEALMSIPHEDKHFLPRISQELQLLKISIPTEEQPVTEPIQKLLLTLLSTSPHCSSLHLTHNCNTFPGQIDDSDVKLEEQWIELDIQYEGMYSTGLYAGPGDDIIVEFECPVPTIGLQIQIGCHTDNISAHENWSRFPLIVTKKTVKPGETTIISQNRFGGLVYINANQYGCSLGLTRIKISGCVAAPYFVLGKTNVRDWREEIRFRKAPWAELANSKIILTFPSKSIRDLKDPEPVMLFWESILKAYTDLSGRCKLKPERIVADVQISCGYMHAGYPIMIHIDEAVETALDIKKLLSTSAWGHLHELGHNNQESEWTFDGTIEVTCNIFTLYVLTTLCGLSFIEARDVFEPVKIKAAIAKFCNEGKNFDAWKNDPFLALLFYYQLQQEFGWGAFKKVFAHYRHLGENETPKTNQEKMDLWLVIFSNIVDFNLYDFFISWGIPVSEITQEVIAHLSKSELNIDALLT